MEFCTPENEYKPDWSYKADRSLPPEILSLKAGYLIPNEEARKWAVRYAKKDVYPTRVNIALQLKRRVLERVAQSGVRTLVSFDIVGHREAQFMVVTQVRSEYIGYEDDQPSADMFTEGDREAQVRMFLTEEGEIMSRTTLNRG